MIELIDGEIEEKNPEGVNGPHVLSKYNYWRESVGLSRDKILIPKYFSQVDCSCNMESCSTCIGY